MLERGRGAPTCLPLGFAVAVAVAGRVPVASPQASSVGARACFCRADCERRERQRQMKNDEERPSPEAASEEFFRAVEPEARRNMFALRRDSFGFAVARAVR